MRIIGGKYGRRVIKPPKNLPVRPTTDLAKESLFNILNHRIDFTDKVALDLFSGTGALSYELASRGCKEVIAVEQNFQCLKFITKTAGDFGITSIKALRYDVFKFIKSTPKKFDFIFADPPYALGNISEISELVFTNQLLAENGWLVVEHPKEVNFSNQDYFYEHRRYGQVNFSFFNYSDSK